MNIYRCMCDSAQHHLGYGVRRDIGRQDSKNWDLKVRAIKVRSVCQRTVHRGCNEYKRFSDGWLHSPLTRCLSKPIKLRVHLSDYINAYFGIE